MLLFNDIWRQELEFDLNEYGIEENEVWLEMFITNHKKWWFEQIRLASFQNWPLDFIDPIALAKNGFYYLKKDRKMFFLWTFANEMGNRRYN